MIHRDNQFLEFKQGCALLEREQRRHDGETTRSEVRDESSRVPVANDASGPVTSVRGCHTHVKGLAAANWTAQQCERGDVAEALVSAQSRGKCPRQGIRFRALTGSNAMEHPDQARAIKLPSGHSASERVGNGESGTEFGRENALSGSHSASLIGAKPRQRGFPTTVDNLTADTPHPHV